MKPTIGIHALKQAGLGVASLPAKVVHLYSGGLDSTILLYDLVASGIEVQPMLVDYGQKHKKELHWAGYHCQKLGLKPVTRNLAGALGMSALVDGKGGNVVPGRNMLFISVACCLAGMIGAKGVTIGCNMDDREDFPDCRPLFISAMFHSASFGTPGVGVFAPYSNRTKKEIVDIGLALGVELDRTWSCYRGGDKQCGECPACAKNKKAMPAPSAGEGEVKL